MKDAVVDPPMCNPLSSPTGLLKGFIITNCFITSGSIPLFIESVLHGKRLLSKTEIPNLTDLPLSRALKQPDHLSAQIINMAKSFSFNKRQKEKLKQQKKLEKQKRKELRKSQGKDSIDDMIAYEDEYGQLHSSPDDIVKNEIKLEDIEVSTPKKEKEDEEDTSMTGKVSYLNVEKGYGFIQQEDSRNSYYFRLSNAPDEIEIDDKVSFKTEDSARGKNEIDVVISSR